MDLTNENGFWITRNGRRLFIRGYSKKYIPTPKRHKSKDMLNKFITANTYDEVINKTKDILGKNAQVYKEFEQIPKYNNNDCVENTKKEYTINKENKMITGYVIVKKGNEYGAVAHNFNKNGNTIKDYTIIPKQYGTVTAYIGTSYINEYKRKNK